MKLNLEVLKDEILSQLKAQGLVVFHGVRRRGDSRPAAYWDAERTPEFSEFLVTAKQAGAKMVVFSHLQFAAEMLEDALDQLDEYELPSGGAAGVRTAAARDRRLSGLHLCAGSFLRFPGPDLHLRAAGRLVLGVPAHPRRDRQLRAR